MKKSVYSLALAGLLSIGMAGAAFAQDNAAPPDQGPPPTQDGHGPRRMDPDQQLKRMTKQLDLTADQQTQIKPILVSRDQQIQQLFQDQSAAPADRRGKMKAIQDDSRAKIEAVLNDTQKQKYAQMEQRMHDHMRQPQGGDQGGPPQQ